MNSGNLYKNDMKLKHLITVLLLLTLSQQGYSTKLVWRQTASSGCNSSNAKYFLYSSVNQFSITGISSTKTLYSGFSTILFKTTTFYTINPSTITTNITNYFSINDKILISAQSYPGAVILNTNVYNQNQKMLISGVKYNVTITSTGYINGTIEFDDILSKYPTLEKICVIITVKYNNNLTNFSSSWLKLQVTKPKFSLYNNIFRPSQNEKLTLKYSITTYQPGIVFKIYNLLGEYIKTIKPDESQLQPGNHTVVWTGDFENGTLVPSGTYFVITNLQSVDTNIGKVVVIR